ncbi:MAG: sigma-70 family RNA polymerase sigma factor [Phycisphaeraceae bacterium]|nr:sigma-70 family RNA polymerase sigma factor [Phycisphaeraceae bacterium]
MPGPHAEMTNRDGKAVRAPGETPGRAAPSRAVAAGGNAGTGADDGSWRGVARGEAEAIERLYEEWFDRAYAMSRRLTGRDEAFCLDVVHDAFVRVIGARRVIGRIASKEELDRWMSRVVRTAALDRLRGESRRRAREAGRSAADQPRVAAEDELNESREALEQWINAVFGGLDEGDRELLSLRFGRGQTLERAAAVLGVTKGAAHGRIRRVLARLRVAAQEWWS